VLKTRASTSITILFGPDYMVSDISVPAISTDIHLTVDPYWIDAS